MQVSASEEEVRRVKIQTTVSMPAISVTKSA
jgi:hypothetical protein